MHRDLGMRGVWAALATPLDGNDELDASAFAAHADALLAAGCDGVAPFGTTGEGPSFTVAERQGGLDALLAAGIRPDRIVAGIGAASVGDAIVLARHALSLGVDRFLMLPPFYFKDIDDNGLHAAFARTIDRIGNDRTRLLLYHIPQVSQVVVTATVIERLLASHPGIVAGIKDSTGNLDHTLSLARRFRAISVFCGAEEHLPALLEAGGAGTICGLANLVPRLMTRLRDGAGARELDDPLSRIACLANAITDGPFVPRLKALLAAATGEDGWRRVRAPLTAPPMAEEARLIQAVLEIGALHEDWPVLGSAAGALR